MIPIRNIYYMLSYAFRVLNEQGYKSIETEQFNNVGDLCAAILAKGVAIQIKRGLGREYLEVSEEISSLRGKIDISESIKQLSMQRKKLVCTYDEFSVNSYMNRIIKTTMCLLLKSKISSARKKELRKLLVYFDDIDLLDVYSINWHIQYNRNNQTYRMLISICYLVIKGLLQTQSDGSTKLMDFLDEQRMCHLYEKFILEYYIKEHSKINASASQIKWQLDDGFDELLPIMQSDIMLSFGKNTLIIDAKYYGSSLQEQYGVYSAHSNNLYQIYTYVKNKEGELSYSPHEKVAGMLLYAQTDKEGAFEKNYMMQGNPISIKTLDLSGNFESIRFQLDSIAEKYLYKSKPDTSEISKLYVSSCIDSGIKKWSIYYDDRNGIHQLEENFKPLIFDTQSAAEVKLKEYESERRSEDSADAFSIEDAEVFAENQKWKYASTYAKTAPHEYLVKKWLSEEDKLQFERLVQTINKESVVGYFYGHKNNYLILGDHYYWYMPCYPENMAVDLINRTTTDFLEYRDGVYYYKPKKLNCEN